MASRSIHSTAQKLASGPELRQRVRIIAKIRPFLDSEIGSSQGLPAAGFTVEKPDGDSSGPVTLLVEDQTSREPYKVDYCYGQDEDAEKVFSLEVKPLLAQLFQGFNAAILAYGARGSGKTHMIQGSDEKPGLASLAIAEILSIAEDMGGSISVSCYEIYQDHIYDLLEPKEVQIWESNGGKVQLKGLSQVPVHSISDFNKLCFPESNQKRIVERSSNDVKHRPHKGLLLHVICTNEHGNATTIGKINIIDLAGYEDTKRLTKENPHLADCAKMNNKSLYALQNVIYALNTKEKRVPFRESKLTRMLRDYVDGNNRVLMITCVDPAPCQDAVHTVSVSSRLCQAGTGTCQETTKVPSKIICSTIRGGSQILQPKVGKKHETLKHLIADKKNNHKAPAKTHERKLVCATPPTTKSIKENLLTSATPCAALVLGDSVPVIETDSQPLKKSTEKPVPIICEAVDQSVSTDEVTKNSLKEEESLPTDTNETACFTPKTNSSPQGQHSHENNNRCRTEQGAFQGSGKQNETKSPPISTRLREITNTLKSLRTPVPLCDKSPIVENFCNSQASIEHYEPKTPSILFSMTAQENSELTTAATPSEMYQTRSCGLKKSLVKEYLSYLNTANKEELKALKGIGEKRATYILELREESPEPFKSLESLWENFSTHSTKSKKASVKAGKIFSPPWLDDLKNIGLSAKQVNIVMRKAAEALFT